ncbi:hypothetical protein [Roseovarius arcticus]|uniref:hypothetical protein n=1 Tax=Roseovarius arcticus TaxID=2547404 RepID=UPI001110F20D|nr:hypothetical protein [Roseovarius arcticus]
MRFAASIPFGRASLVCALLLAIAGCKRASEAEMRTMLAEWVPLGDTVAFEATRGCAAGLFDVVDGRIASRMRVATSVQEAAMVLRGNAAVAIDDTSLTPDAAMLELMQADRSAGMTMRMAGLEGRVCMDSDVQGAFAAALVNPRAVLLVGHDRRILALMDVDAGLLIAAMGAK